MSWLYAAGILFVGVGLHTFLRRWTTLGVMVLFVMLNFTSSGGIYRPELQPGFFGALHSFWNGAGYVEGVRGHVYFDGHAVGGHVLVLAFWFLAGVALVVAAGLTESRRAKARGQVPGQATGQVQGKAEATATATATATASTSARAKAEVEEEMEEAVAV
ncbi:hypothetical protein [Streptomyces sp. P9-A4]|uniref:hypothetical protein n=1 Tax=Streptomyces sp. P9-A4 TaxID=3072285 RepID=UPI003FCC8B16